MSNPRMEDMTQEVVFYLDLYELNGMRPIEAPMPGMQMVPGAEAQVLLYPGPEEERPPPVLPPEPEEVHPASVPPLVGSHADRLPDELLVLIFSQLPLDSLVTCSRVCDRWNGLLKGRKSVWKNREFTVKGVLNVGKVLDAVDILPPLKSVRIMCGGDFCTYIAWPHVTVTLNNNIHRDYLPTNYLFPTEQLYVSRYVADDDLEFMKWVKPEMLQWLHVGDQCMGCIPDPKDPRYKLVRTKRCVNLDCLLHGKSPSNYRTLLGSGGSVTRNGAKCPILEQLSVSCVYLSNKCLENMCKLGPVRALRVACHILQSLAFVTHLAANLELLSVVDCIMLAVDAVAGLANLKKLRILEISCKCVPDSDIEKYAKDLSALEAFVVHGREMKTSRPHLVCREGSERALSELTERSSLAVTAVNNQKPT